MNTKEILTEAHRLGVKHGVAKGSFITPEGSMCINGLIGAAICGAPLGTCSDYNNMVKSETFQKAIAVVAPIVGLPANWDDLAVWNNTVATDEDVLTALSKAAEVA